jgi:hypothetical protein
VQQVVDVRDEVGCKMTLVGTLFTASSRHLRCHCQVRSSLVDFATLKQISTREDVRAIAHELFHDRPALPPHELIQLDEKKKLGREMAEGVWGP